jgi:bifunctional DNase/RNase
MSKIEVKVDMIRQALLGSNLEYPWVVLFKSISSDSYLPVHISSVQAELIQKIMLDEEPMPLDSLLNDLDLPVEQMSKGTLESIVIEPKGENLFVARLILRHSKKHCKTQAELPIGNAVALSLITKAPIFIEEALLIKTNGSYSY